MAEDNSVALPGPRIHHSTGLATTVPPLRALAHGYIVA
jgi:hypothetical protein